MFLRASFLVMYSPLQMAADLPEHYLKFFDAFQFIKDVAIDWDSSVYLEAEPGHYITIARKEKNSERWFVGNSNGELTRISEIDLSFLNESQTYLAKIYRDSEDSDYKTNPQSYTIETKEVTKQTTLQIKTVAAGGYAISLHPLNK